MHSSSDLQRTACAATPRSGMLLVCRHVAQARELRVCAGNWAARAALHVSIHRVAGRYAQVHLLLLSIRRGYVAALLDELRWPLYAKECELEAKQLVWLLLVEIQVKLEGQLQLPMTPMRLP
jgi:hypothetical protein